MNAPAKLTWSESRFGPDTAHWLPRGPESLLDHIPGEDGLPVIGNTLEQLRDVEIAYELAQCRALLPSGRTRDALKVQREQQELAAAIERDVRTYWEGDHSDEPFLKLSGDTRAQLLLHARDLSDVALAHFATLIEGTPLAHDRAVQRAVLSAGRSPPATSA